LTLYRTSCGFSSFTVSCYSRNTIRHLQSLTFTALRPIGFKSRRPMTSDSISTDAAHPPNVFRQSATSSFTRSRGLSVYPPNSPTNSALEYSKMNLMVPSTQSTIDRMPGMASLQFKESRNSSTNTNAGISSITTQTQSYDQTPLSTHRQSATQMHVGSTTTTVSLDNSSQRVS